MPDMTKELPIIVNESALGSRCFTPIETATYLLGDISHGRSSYDKVWEIISRSQRRACDRCVLDHVVFDMTFVAAIRGGST